MAAAPQSTRRRDEAPAPDGLAQRLGLPRWLDQVLLWGLGPLLTLLAYRTLWQFDFVGDGRMLVLDNEYMRSLDYLWGNLTHNYFWSSAGQMVPYWRPVTKASWLLEYQLFGDWAGGYLLVSLGWHLLSVVGTQLLALRLGAGRALALVAGLVVGLHPVAIPPVSMLMARSDVVATAATVWALLTWWQWRRPGPHRARWAATHVLCLLLALGSKESAVALPGVLTLWSLLSGDGRANHRRALLRLVPAWTAAIVTLLLRSWLLGAEAKGLSSVELGLDPLRLAACLGKYLTNLWPFWLSSGVRDLPIREAQSLGFWLVAAPSLLAAALLLAFAIRRRDRAMLLGFVWLLAALAPVLLTAKIHVPAVQDKYPLADRWLLHALPGAAVVWTALVRLVDRRWLRHGVAALAATWALVVLIQADEARAEFADEMAMLDNEDRAYYHATPPEFRTAQDHCRFHERRVERAVRRQDDPELLRVFGDLVSACETVHRDRWLQLLRAQLRLGRYEQAEPVVRGLLAHPPSDLASQAWLAKTAGVVFLKTGHDADAERWLTRAEQLGVTECRLHVWLAEAIRAQRRSEDAIARLERAFACGGGRDPSLLLAAATWALETGHADDTVRLLDQVEGGHRLSADQQHQVDFLRKRLAGETSDERRTPVLRR